MRRTSTATETLLFILYLLSRYGFFLLCTSILLGGSLRRLLSAVLMSAHCSQGPHRAGFRPPLNLASAVFRVAPQSSILPPFWALLSSGFIFPPNGTFSVPCTGPSLSTTLSLHPCAPPLSHSMWTTSWHQDSQHHPNHSAPAPFSSCLQTSLPGRPSGASTSPRETPSAQISPLAFPKPGGCLRHWASPWAPGHVSLVTQPAVST